MPSPTTPTVPVSWGELIDKITILDIKLARLSAAAALANVGKEHALLSAIAAPAMLRPGVPEQVAALRDVNAALWIIEDAIREEEAANRFAAEFVRLARSVYHRNDERAAIKRRINALLDSELVEEKSYASFAPAPAPDTPAGVTEPAR